MRTLRVLLLLSAIFALSTTGVFLIRLSRDVHAIAQQTLTTTVAIQTSVTDTMHDTQRTLQVATGVLGIARAELKSQQDNLSKESEGLLQTTKNINALTAQATLTLQHVDINSAQSLDQLTLALQSIPPVMTQLTLTAQSAQKTVNDVGDVAQSVNKIVAGPVMDTAQNADHVTTLITKQIDAAFAPQPWWKKAWGVTKLGMKMLTIPITK